MKRLGNLVLAAALLIVLILTPATVCADVIVYPDNTFFEENIDSCTLVRREYITAGPDGKVTVYESPVSDKVVGIVENGNTLYISYAYTDDSGNQWGCYENWDEDYCGWIPMAYLTLVYDAQSFQEEHGHEVISENGSFSEVYFKETAKFHEYPGSPEYEEVPVKDWNGGRGANTYSKVYVDPHGDKWVMVDKEFYIMKDAWVNLNGDRQQEEIIPISQKPDPALIITAAVCVVAVVGVTWMLLVAVKKKK